MPVRRRCVSAADGYGRKTAAPACTLLHLGPGYANAGPNLHKAGCAGAPVVNIIGYHATCHRQHDAPLHSDSPTWASANSLWTRSADTDNRDVQLAAEALHLSFRPKGGCACLSLPADSAWNKADRQGPLIPPSRRQIPSANETARDIDTSRSARLPALLIGGTACREASLASARRMAAGAAGVLIDMFVARQARGYPHFDPDRMKYFAEDAAQDLAACDLLVLIDTSAPVAFFAYPDRPSLLASGDDRVITGRPIDGDGVATLAIPAEAMGLALSAPSELPHLSRPTGNLKPATVGISLARPMPDGAMLSDDGVTASASILATTRTAPPHDWLMLAGGAKTPGNSACHRRIHRRTQAFHRFAQWRWRGHVHRAGSLDPGASTA